MEPLTIYGELSSIPWTVKGFPAWTVAIHNTNALYWEFKLESEEHSAEDFILFLRTVLPNGGAFIGSHSNHSIIWCPVEGDSYGVGIRKLQYNNVWIIAVLECMGEYPGAGNCPDRAMSLEANRFLAEEFLRGTSGRDVYMCEEAILRDSQSWWLYLEKLEKVVNWKYPEAKIYRDRMEELKSIQHRDPRLAIPQESTAGETKKTTVRSRTEPGSLKQDQKRAAHSSRETDSKKRRTRYTSPMMDERAAPKSRPFPKAKNPNPSPPTNPADPFTSLNDRPALMPNTNALVCERCDKSFQHSYDLMKHFNSESHLAALSKEFQI